MAYKIEMRYLYGWDDAGWTFEENQPMRFTSIDEAEAELEDFFIGLNKAVAAGDMDLGYPPHDFRIVEASKADDSPAASAPNKINLVVLPMQRRQHRR